MDEGQLIWDCYVSGCPYDYVIDTSENQNNEEKCTEEQRIKNIIQKKYSPLEIKPFDTFNVSLPS